MQRAKAQLDFEGQEVAHTHAYARPATPLDVFVPSPVTSQHRVLQAAFGDYDTLDEPKFSKPTRVAIIVGGSIMLWSLIAGGAGLLIKLAQS